MQSYHAVTKFNHARIHHCNGCPFPSYIERDVHKNEMEYNNDKNQTLKVSKHVKNATNRKPIHLTIRINSQSHFLNLQKSTWLLLLYQLHDSTGNKTSKNKDPPYSPEPSHKSPVSGYLRYLPPKTARYGRYASSRIHPPKRASPRERAIRSNAGGNPKNNKKKLVGGFFPPLSEKYAHQIGNLPPNRGENKNKNETST